MRAGPRSPTAEAEVLKTSQCGFESHRGHGTRNALVPVPQTSAAARGRAAGSDAPYSGRKWALSCDHPYFVFTPVPIRWKVWVPAVTGKVSVMGRVL